MAIEFDNPVTAGTVLVREAIQSQNYAQGSAGWIIEADGDAEFNNLVIRGTFNGQNFIINNSGLFFYNGTPTTGNLIVSIANASGTDQYGNDYIQGITTYLGDEFSNLSFGNLVTGLLSEPLGNAGLVGTLGDSSGIVLQSSNNATLTQNSFINLISGIPSTVPINNVNYPHVRIDQMAWIADALVKFDFLTGPETWHTVGTTGNAAFNTNWATSTSFGGSNTPVKGLRYKKDALDNVCIEGAAVASSTTQTVFTLPSGYFNPNERSFVNGNTNIGGTIKAANAIVTETGAVAFTPSASGVTIASGSIVYINGSFPLGNLS